MASAANPLLLPYQRRYVEDPARYRLWVASRQIGKSFALSLDAAKTSQEDKRTDILMLSASQRQSTDLMRKFYRHLQAFRRLTRSEALALRENRTECELAAGNTVFSLPANPETARGYTAHVYLDEFAIHRDSRGIWTALYPSITRGYRLSVASTPMGKQGKFWDLYSRNDQFSKHITSIWDAVADGLQLDPEELRAGLDDPEAWAQEYECRFVDEATAFLPHELIAACEMDPDLTTPPAEGDVFLGMDIGRRRDLTVLWSLRDGGGVRWTVEVLVMTGRPFREQRDELFRRLEHARRACLDATGLGMQLAEEAQEAFGSRVEAVTFTGAVKEALAYNLRTAMEDRLVRIPLSREIHNDLHSVKRITTAAGNARFDVEASETTGHADRFWALALALDAASTPVAKIAYGSVARRRSADFGEGSW